MANLFAGVGTSHVPVIGAMMDHKKTNDPQWKKLFDGYEPVRQWMKKEKPDVIIMVYNDHASAFTLDINPTFAIGLSEEFHPADEGYGPRKVPVVKGHPKLAWHITEQLILNEFDITMVNNIPVDHGLTVPLSIACGEVDEWPCQVIPLCVNVIQYPQPTGNRCFNLGKEIRKAVDSFDEDLKVVIFGTGGMSHQLQGERAGLVNADFDIKFLDDLTQDVDRLVNIKHVEYLRESGSEGAELVMWMIMRGALDDDVEETYRDYFVPASNTGAGIIVLENKE